MPKNFIKGLAVVSLGLLLAGCASGNGGGVSARSYVLDKPRVDQNMQGGNQGYLMGTPKEEDRSQYSKTRKMYVMEFTKEDPEPGDSGPYVPPGDSTVTVTTQPSASSRVSTESDLLPERSAAERPSSRRQPIVIPSFDDEPSAVSTRSRRVSAESDSDGTSASVGTDVEYTIQKTDTLQKISKKFYNTYSKWQKIYDYNKAVIQDPNRIKVGTVIRIPAE